MLDVLEKHLSSSTPHCIVGAWIATLSKEEQDAFARIKENNKSVKLIHLYNDLTSQQELPFKITIFRAHLRGYCTCQM